MKQFSYDTPFQGIGIPFANMKGQLTWAGVPGSNDQWFIYDKMGRVVETLQCLPRRCGNSSFDVYRFYTYDLAGNRIGERYFSNAAGGPPIDTFYDYTVAGEVSAIRSSQGGNLLSNVVQTVNGPDSFHFANGLNSKTVYDALSRPWGTYLCSGAAAYQCFGSTQLYGYERAMSGASLTSMTDTILTPTGTLPTTSLID